MNNKIDDLLNEACEEILNNLVAKHACLQLDNKLFGAFDSKDAMEIVADLVEALNFSEEIEVAHKTKDWGK